MQRSVREKRKRNRSLYEEGKVFTRKIEVFTRKIEVFTDDFDE